jgi:hypothetical protein
MEEFAKAMLSKEEDKMGCSACEAQLAEYVDAQVMGIEPTEDFAQIELHLQVCPHCARAYRELLGLVTSAYIERVPRPARKPRFDFSFLQTEPAELFWWWDELGRLIIEFSAELVRALRPLAHQPAYAMVKSPKSSRTLCQLSLKEEVGEDLEVTITAEEMRDDSALCTAIVEVNIPSRGGWPKLANTEVTLKRGEAELETQLTDAYGEAIFEGISTDDLAHLVFEITPRT